MISQANMSKLLGRPLTVLETANYATYINIATQMLDTMLCTTMAYKGISKTYRSKVDMSEVFVDPFTTIVSVKINDVVRTDYTIKQNDYYDADWYNVLEFDSCLSGEKVVVEADWGFGGCPVDLEMLVSQLFKLASTGGGTASNVKRKKIEDAEIEYFGGENASAIDTLKNDYAMVISKYSNCTGYLLHGGNYA